LIKESILYIILGEKIKGNIATYYIIEIQSI